MGAALSLAPPPPANVDLLPPRFSPPPPPPASSASPALAADARRARLLSDHFAPPGLSLHAALRPEAAGGALLTAGLAHSAPGASALVFPPPQQALAARAAAAAPLLPALAEARGSVQLCGSGRVDAEAAVVDVRPSAAGCAFPPSALYVAASSGGSGGSGSGGGGGGGGGGREPPAVTLGARYSSASSAWTAGGALGAGAPFPVSLFAMGQRGAGGAMTRKLLA